MQLHALKKNSGYKKPMKQIGRGNGSGKGNYSTRGLKGQGSRSGASTRWWFEGGQTPLTQRVPKARGFKRYFKLQSDVASLNLARIEANSHIKGGDTITNQMLVDLGLIKNGQKVKVLAGKELTKKLTFNGEFAFSAQAKTLVEKAGGSIGA